MSTTEEEAETTNTSLTTTSEQPTATMMMTTTTNGPAENTTTAATATTTNGVDEPEQQQQQQQQQDEEGEGEDDVVILPVYSDDDRDGEEEQEEEDTAASSSPLLRMGTISSARFNMWSTMVGGGSLSLPLAFSKTGNAFVGPFLLLLTACITHFCFHALIQSQRTLSRNWTRPTVGKDSYESIASAAFGPRMHVFGTALVTLMCFFGIVGYAVLLRDMLEPVTDFVFPKFQRSPLHPSLYDNCSMWSIVLLVTPLCTLQNLTSLQRFGAASMCSILILGVCILFRSLECTMGHGGHHFREAFTVFPKSWKDVLDVLPLYISCYVCHYNLPVVHNELRQPTPPRVRWWLSSTIWGSTLFYLILGISGSAYRPCSSTPDVQGNILLNFPEDDPLLLVGRLCLAVTITLAFPMLTIPARDILIRLYRTYGATTMRRIAAVAPVVTAEAGSLEEPFLPPEEDDIFNNNNDEEEPRAPQGFDETIPDTAITASSLQRPQNLPPSLWLRLSASMVVFWTGVAVASCVSSIDVVWDLLGSSLSILLSHLIPCGCFLVIMATRQHDDDSSSSFSFKLQMAGAAFLMILFTPLMFISTANAIYNTFFREQ